MSKPEQLSMFEPEGVQLAKLVSVHFGTYEFERRKSINLEEAGYFSTAVACANAADAAWLRAAVCESALQFEQLAGLA